MSGAVSCCSWQQPDSTLHMSGAVCHVAADSKLTATRRCHVLRVSPTIFWKLVLLCVYWVIPRPLNFIVRRFGTLYLFHLHRQVGE